MEPLTVLLFILETLTIVFPQNISPSNTQQKKKDGLSMVVWKDPKQVSITEAKI